MICGAAGTLNRNMPYKHTFTVFTATYNRARTLPRVYNSLKAQTFRNFEWLVIDTGQGDNTRELVAQWAAAADFPVRYYASPGYGKHKACNQAVALAAGGFFLTLDSDDEAVPNALERFKYHWDNIPDDLKPKFSAVTAFCKDQHGHIIGRKLDRDFIDSDSLEIWYKYGIRGEKWGFQRTDVMKEFPFPDMPGKFVPEGVIWSAIARKYKTRYINEVLRIYWLEPKKTSDQLTLTMPPAQIMHTHLFWHAGILKNEMGWFFYNPAHFLRSALHYGRFSLLAGISLAEQYKNLPLPARPLWLLMLPLAWLAALRDRIKFPPEKR